MSSTHFLRLPLPSITKQIFSRRSLSSKFKLSPFSTCNQPSHRPSAFTSNLHLQRSPSISFTGNARPSSYSTPYDRCRIVFSRSNSSLSSNPELLLSPPIISKHLIFIAGLVFTIVVVGGYTRLTESGLSITEWNLVSGILPPLNAEDWEKEFAKYRATPEFKLLNHAIGLEEFKKIFFWEWAHRIMGRVIGLSFLLPIPIFIRYGLIRTKKTGWSLAGIGGLIGLQGGLGWYMVQSGLDQKELDQRDGVPRVSQYRLAAHLLMAFTVYSACIRLAGGLWRDWKVAVLDRPLFQHLNRHKISSALESIQLLNNKLPTRARFFIGSLTGLIFLTAGSGAFVAGLDAGLVYNTFPKMGDRWMPPQEELFSELYTNRGKQGPPNGEGGRSIVDLSWMRNIFENPTTVQFNHRVLGTLTFISSLSWAVFIEKNKHLVPRSTLNLSRLIALVASNQVGLGIATLVYLVPTNLALLHQANSLLLLSVSLFAGLSLRRPGALALKSVYKHSQTLLHKPKTI
ncbi:Cytochrome c oxidase assembly protein cox15 [Puccinia graminis f. sp. tritici]|uniref:Cytochrome c oxidase assembly protein cox15 n=2 Tax=Puccinia graminis f. sp. tritici TaxID=56615 RepID=E3KD48_PUCGT|nr:uncharacterized protein PGTG_07491 [Puccinia graminis f. sp. tritici CRL 75-36-700-3]EFP82094.1 hypothetical protein PGTG_07491 [Puccinia graminis f. sp. tritici CRL 75-36-700-3]KAA1064883.1 Cytochrome c oxidase assembly protein cox15 [Puccinia graminis f. sp. tritici]